MVSAYDVDPQRLIEETAKVLKEEYNLEFPEWALWVKTGPNRERPPEQKDWWYVRAASILRRLYVDGPVGVERLRTYYGGRKNRGLRPSHSKKASGKIIRVCLQQLEQKGLVEKTKDGRVLSSKGRSLLDKLAGKILKEGSEDGGK